MSLKINSDMPNIAGDTIALCPLPTNWNIIHCCVAELTVTCQLFYQKLLFYSNICCWMFFFVYYKNEQGTRSTSVVDPKLFFRIRFRFWHLFRIQIWIRHALNKVTILHCIYPPDSRSSKYCLKTRQIFKSVSIYLMLCTVVVKNLLIPDPGSNPGQKFSGSEHANNFRSGRIRVCIDNPVGCCQLTLYGRSINWYHFWPLLILVRYSL
jgi:hypothetical protein